jgi:hypothetical protein
MAPKAASIPAPNAAPYRKAGQMDAVGAESGTAIEATYKIESTGCGSSPSLQSAPDITPGPGDVCRPHAGTTQFVDAALVSLVYRNIHFF